MSFTYAGDKLGLNHAADTTLHSLFYAKNKSYTGFSNAGGSHNIMSLNHVCNKHCHRGRNTESTLNQR